MLQWPLHFFGCFNLTIVLIVLQIMVIMLARMHWYGHYLHISMYFADMSYVYSWLTVHMNVHSSYRYMIFLFLFICIGVCHIFQYKISHLFYSFWRGPRRSYLLTIDGKQRATIYEQRWRLSFLKSWPNLVKTSFCWNIVTFNNPKAKL